MRAIKNLDGVKVRGILLARYDRDGKASEGLRQNPHIAKLFISQRRRNKEASRTIMFGAHALNIEDETLQMEQDEERGRILWKFQFLHSLAFGTMMLSMIALVGLTQ